LIWYPRDFDRRSRVKGSSPTGRLGEPRDGPQRSRDAKTTQRDTARGEREQGPVYYAKWRDEGWQVKRRLGPAWIERGEQKKAGECRRTRHAGWVKRRGRPAEDHLTEDAAVALIPAAMQEYTAEQARAREQRSRDEQHEASFEEIAMAWLQHRINVVGIKRSTINHYRTMLLRPEDEPKKRGRAPRARIMAKFAGRSAASITTREITRWLNELDRDPLLSARSVNQHRGVLYSIYAYACREDTFGLSENPVSKTEKRREADPAEIVTYTPAEVEAIAREAQRGAHRENRLKLTEAEIETRVGEDEQDACLRSVPLADQPAQALARLSQRAMFTRPGDLVFCSRTGEHLDASALRRRYKAARDKAAKHNRDLPILRFHDLRHTFGTLAAQGFDLVNVQAMMGHADSRTTARYLHARPAAEDAVKLTSIFAKDMPSAITADLAAKA
jgi:site-specific recombinase XerD